MTQSKDVELNKTYGRREDMSPDGKLEVLVQRDGDVILTIFPKDWSKGRESFRYASVEFCTICAGGGKSPRTWQALRELAQAIRDDNQENPQ